MVDNPAEPVPETTPELGAAEAANGGTGQEDEGGEVNNGKEVEDFSLWPEYCNPSYRMPDEIEVKVKLSSGDYYFPVAIEKASSQKLYLGGYRNKETGQIYHHSSTQTPTISKKEVKDVSKLRCRETQTYEERTVSVQPYRKAALKCNAKTYSWTIRMTMK